MNIQGYENYIIYDDGDIYSRNVNRYLSPNRTNKAGYNIVDLYKNGKYNKFKVHRLVALHYIPNPDNKPCVDHIDGNKLNNNVENLRWVTHQENDNAFRTINTNNTSGIKNITYCKKDNLWRYKKQIFGKLTRKYFKTKEEAIAFKTEFELLNPRF